MTWSLRPRHLNGHPYSHSSHIFFLRFIFFIHSFIEFRAVRLFLSAVGTNPETPGCSSSFLSDCNTSTGLPNHLCVYNCCAGQGTFPLSRPQFTVYFTRSANGGENSISICKIMFRLDSNRLNRHLAAAAKRGKFTQETDLWLNWKLNCAENSFDRVFGSWLHHHVASLFQSSASRKLSNSIRVQ